MEQIDKMLFIAEFIKNSSEEEKILFNKIIGEDANKLTKQFTNQHTNYEQKAKKTLLNLYFKPNLLGFKFTTNGLVLIKNNINLLGAITKELYPQIATINQDLYMTPSKIERAIRHSVELSWANLQVNTPLLQNVFGHIKTSKPSNSEFLASVHYYIEAQEENEKSLVLSQQTLKQYT